MSKNGEVAYKLCGGDKLTITEFQTAVEYGMLKGGKLKTQEQLASAYLEWIAGYYEDSKQKGYLCTSSATKKTKDLPNGGFEMCLWGIHLDEVQPDKLTPQNLKFLRHYFGKDKVKQITGK